ncbi:hypothetical protein [Lacrimispora sp.]|uniref:hypothetical protein n=1 Tax=Lacrimispora sp. TaxID=2719234 RepID=UPI0028AD1645|nr:hypothetical protein [Lacrimispora sp.]
MKKQILILCVVLVIGVTGCGSKKVAETELSKETVQQSSSIEETTEAATTAEELVKRENTNFRNTCWGDDIETVKKYETDISWTAEADNAIIGQSKSKVLNMNADIGFTFGDGKLYQGAIMFNDEHTNENLYIDDFNTIKNALKEKYGEPTEDKQVWKSDLYKGDVGRYGKAISYGHLQYLTIWENEDTRIVLGLIGDNYKINLGIVYGDVNHKEEVNNSGL